MSRSKPLGLLQYLCLSEEERHFHQIKGYLPSDNSHEAITRTDLVNPPKDKGGRPKRKFHINERRAYCLWLIAKQISEETRIKTTNRELIEIARNKPFRDLFKKSTSQETLEQSISRGKTALKIDKEWRSEVCDLLEQVLNKLQP